MKQRGQEELAWLLKSCQTSKEPDNEAHKIIFICWSDCTQSFIEPHVAWEGFCTWNTACNCISSTFARQSEMGPGTQDIHLLLYTLIICSTCTLLIATSLLVDGIIKCGVLLEIAKSSLQPATPWNIGVHLPTGYSVACICMMEPKFTLYCFSTWLWKICCCYCCPSWH